MLRTHDGLEVADRQNLWDAEIVREVFFEKPYTRHLRLAPNPVVVDVGSYIGDFALYAVKYLDARRVVAYEAILERVLNRLSSAGYQLREDGKIVSASRARARAMRSGR